MKPLPNPKEPLNAAEVDEHESRGHFPPRKWCIFCDAGRGRIGPHFHDEAVEERHGVPFVSTDYFFLGVDEERAQPMILIKDHKSKHTHATTVDAKGVTKFSVDNFVQFLHSLGHKRLILKSDNEPALLALKTAVKKESGIDIIFQEVAVGDHAANGMAEAGVREIAKECRVIKACLEHRLGSKLHAKHPLLAPIPAYAAAMWSRCWLQESGKTAYHLNYGKEFKRRLPAYGEKCLYRKIKEGVKATKWQVKWELGRFVGIAERSDELVFLTEKGLIKAKQVQRIAPSERWKDNDLDNLKGLPWNTDGGEKGIIEIMPATMTDESTVVEGRDFFDKVDENAGPRNTYVLKPDIRKYGYTAGCAGCDAIRAGAKRSVVHNPECRLRIEGRMMEDPKGRARLEASEARFNKSLDDEVARLEAAKRKEREDNTGQQPMEDVEEQLVDSPTSKTEKTTLGAGDKEARTIARASGGTDGGASSSSSAGAAAATSRVAGALKRPASQEIDKETTKDEIRLEEKKRPAEPQPTKKGVARKQQSSPGSPGGHRGPGGDLGSLDNGNWSRVLELCSMEVSGDEQQDEKALVQLIAEMELMGVDVAEIYSPERFTREAPTYGLVPGFAVDLECTRPWDRQKWVLSLDEHVQDLRWLQTVRKPRLLCGSPPCDAFTAMLRINKGRMTQESYDTKKENGRRHLRIAVESYWRQMDMGNFFLHEHPDTADSHQEPELVELAADPRVWIIRAPMCAWGLKATDQQGTSLVQKMSRFYTNSEVLARRLNKLCSNKDPSSRAPWHRHVQLICGRPAEARKYTPAFVKEVLSGLIEEMTAAGQISNIEVGVTDEQPWYEPKDEEDWRETMVAVDDVSNKFLKIDKVHAARAEEVEQIHVRKIYDKVPMARCFEETGGPPVPTGWLDINKAGADANDGGEDKEDNYRSRLVAKELRAWGGALGFEELIFASSLPIECLKLLISIWVTRKVSRAGKPLKLRFKDVKRAHWQAPATRRLFVELPPEDGGGPGAQQCGLMRMSMYGTQDAAGNWERSYTDNLEKGGYEQGMAMPAIFINEEDDVLMMCHGDDFASLVDDDGQEKFGKLMDNRFENTTRATLGPEPYDDKQAIILNRQLRIVRDYPLKVDYECDARHVPTLIEQFGMKDAKPAATPGITPTVIELEKSPVSPPCSRAERKQYRSGVMRGQYMGTD